MVDTPEARYNANVEAISASLGGLSLLDRTMNSGNIVNITLLRYLQYMNAKQQTVELSEAEHEVMLYTCVLIVLVSTSCYFVMHVLERRSSNMTFVSSSAAVMAPPSCISVGLSGSTDAFVFQRVSQHEHIPQSVVC